MKTRCSRSDPPPNLYGDGRGATGRTGNLSLDLPVRNYLPEYAMQDPVVTTELTMRHQLTHVGGWDGDHFEDTGNGDDALDRYVKLLADLPQLTRLGTVFSYNNAAFAIAGRVIEVVTGQTYENALKELVLVPLGLNHSYFFPTDVMLRCTPLLSATRLTKVRTSSGVHGS